MRFGGYVYRGSRLPQLRGTYFFGDLCSGRIWGAALREMAAGRCGGSPAPKRPLRARASSDSARTAKASFYVLTSSDVLRIDGPTLTAGGDNVGLFDPDTVTFAIKRSHTSGAADLAFRFGLPGKGWIPIAGDWNGDGRDSVGVFDPFTNTFRLRNALTSGKADIVHDFPNELEDLPLAGDWDGDGVSTPGFYRVEPSEFALTNRTGTAIETVFQFGPPDSGWVPLVGNW